MMGFPGKLYLVIFIIRWLFYVSTKNLQGWQGTYVLNLKPVPRVGSGL